MFPEKSKQQPDWTKIGDEVIKSSDISDLSQRVEFIIPQEDGALTRDGLLEAFPQIEQAFYSRGATKEGALRFSWIAFINYLNRRVVPKIGEYLSDLDESVGREIDVWQRFLEEFRKNVLANRLDKVYPEKESKMSRS